MPVTLTYPGVHIEEIPSGVRTITGVATSITAFVGRTARGPVGEPVVINSYGDFERTFGGLWAESALSFAVRDFFLNGGGQAVIVRLFHPHFGSENEQALALAAANLVTGAAELAVKYVKSARAQAIADAIRRMAELFEDEPNKTAVGAVTKAATDRLKVNGVEPADVIRAAETAADQQSNDTKPAAHAIVHIASLILEAFQADGGGRPQAVVNVASEMARLFTIPSEVDQAATIVTGAQSAADLASSTPAKVAQAALAAVVAGSKAKAVADVATIAVDSFEKLDLAVTEFGKRAETAAKALTAPSAIELQVAQDVAKSIKEYAQSGTLDKSVLAALKDIVSDAAAPSRARLQVDSLWLEAANSGAWGNKLGACVDHDVKDDNKYLFNLTIRDSSVIPERIESFRNLSVLEKDERSADKVLENESRLVRVIGGLPKTRPDPAKVPLLYLRGHDGRALESNDFTGTGKEGASAGLFALERADLFNLLCIPPYKDGGDIDPEVITASAAYCNKRRAILVLDPPSSWATKAGVAPDTINVEPNKKDTAIFFPRLLQPNPLHDNQLETFAPCGAVAGVIARTDAQRGVWKAPAGQEATLAGVPKLSVPLTDAEIGELNPLGVNCLRAMPAAGRVIWGARTMDGADRLASEWKYLPVRRTALFIEESLYRGLQWAVFEPNDEELWSQLRLNVTSFMLTLFRRGAFQGATPSQAFFVKCDRDTNPQENIDLGIVTVQVGFAPLKPAEFVVVQISQKAGQAS